jgi:hypothetical protein
MPIYQYTLFMVLGLLFLLQVAETTVAWLGSANMGLVRYLLSLASGYVEDAIFAFASITLAFWFMSRQPQANNTDCDSDWQPEKLPDVGPGWQHVSLQDIFTDLATYMFLLVVIWYPVLMPIDQFYNVRFIISDQAHQFLKWVSPLAVLGLATALWQLRQRFWSRGMIMANTALNVALVAVTLILAASSPLLNIDVEQWQGVFGLEQLERSARITLVIIALFPAWEIGRDLLRLRKI